MNSSFKIFTKTIIALGAIILVNCLYCSNWKILSLSLCFVMLIFSLIYGLKLFYKLAIFWLKFSILLLLIFFLIGFIGSEFAFDTKFWDHIVVGVNTVLTLLNTVYIIEMFILSITINDILSMKLNIKYLKALILLRTLMTQIVSKFESDKELLSIIPNFQEEENKYMDKIKSVFVKKITHLMAMILFIKEQSEILGPLIDNRILQTYKTSKQTIHAKEIKWYTLTGFTVVVLATTIFIRIPSLAGGYFNFSDVAIIFIALYLGRNEGFIAGALGCSIADIIGGFGLYAPITFIAKGVEGWVSGLAKNNNKLSIYLFPCFGVIIMVCTYFLGETFMPFVKFEGAILNLLPNIIQALFGYIGGIFLYKSYNKLGI